MFEQLQSIRSDWLFRNMVTWLKWESENYFGDISKPICNVYFIICGYFLLLFLTSRKSALKFHKKYRPSTTWRPSILLRIFYKNWIFCIYSSVFSLNTFYNYIFHQLNFNVNGFRLSTMRTWFSLGKLTCVFQSSFFLAQKHCRLITWIFYGGTFMPNSFTCLWIW